MGGPGFPTISVVMLVSNVFSGTVRSLTVLDRRLEVLDMLVVNYLMNLDIDDYTHLAAEMVGCGFLRDSSETKP